MEDWERDEIAWLMASAHLSFVEAVESLADQRAGQQWLNDLQASLSSPHADGEAK